ncbi:hypothetical protein ACP275_08G162300 [Erythranthe tilingii]
MGGGGGVGGASSKLKKAARNFFLQTCGSLCETQQQQSPVLDNSAPTPASNYSSPSENQKKNIYSKKISPEIAGQCSSTTTPSSNKNLCTICLDPLNYNSGQAVFTAQCSHSFHFACISSNVRHGSVTCPICRAHWTKLPLNPHARCSLHNKTADPTLQILDNSIANLRVHRRHSFLHSDDPIEPEPTTSDGPRLALSLAYPNFNSWPHHQASSSYSTMEEGSPNNQACLHMRLTHGPAIDLVLVASSNGPHLRLVKQAMAIVVFSLKPVDRLAIVTYSSTSAVRVFPLRRMTSYGKRTALQLIDRVIYMGQADPIEGLKKGVKILEERAHTNPRSSILHLTDSPSRSHRWFDSEAPVTIQRFNLGLGFVVHEFEEFLSRALGGGVEDVQLMIGEGTMIVRIGELRGGEERKIPLCIGQRGCVYVKYSYRDSGDGECITTGEVVLRMEEKDDSEDIVVPMETRISNAGNLEYHDPFLARRWAKHLHGYRL